MLRETLQQLKKERTSSQKGHVYGQLSWDLNPGHICLQISFFTDLGSKFWEQVKKKKKKVGQACGVGRPCADARGKLVSPG